MWTEQNGDLWLLSDDDYAATITVDEDEIFTLRRYVRTEYESLSAAVKAAEKMRDHLIEIVDFCEGKDAP